MNLFGFLLSLENLNPLCTMLSTTRLISATVGRVVPRYQSCAKWAVEYEQIITARPISDHTKLNRRCALKHIMQHLGNLPMCKVKPLLVGKMIRDLSATSAQTAKRVLFEARDFFNEAVLAGILDSNPAAPIKPPRIRIQRHRLTLDDWRKIRAWSAERQPPWVSRMLDLALVTGQRRSDLAKMRFSDVWDGLLHIEQAKTGSRLALPLALRLDAIGLSIGEAVEACRVYYQGDDLLLRKHNGNALVLASLSARFEEARDAVIPLPSSGLPASLHECRSLSERLYRAQGINTMVLLGHKHQSMTDVYNDDRGLTAGVWKTLEL